MSCVCWVYAYCVLSYTAVQCQMEVSAYLWSKQLLYIGFAEQKIKLKN